MDKHTTALVQDILREVTELTKGMEPTEGISKVDAAMLLVLFRLITTIDRAGDQIANAVI